MSDPAHDVVAPHLPSPTDENQTNRTPLPHRWVLFLAVALGLLMISLDGTSVATALTTIGRDLGVGLAWTSWAITIAAAGQILALPLGGAIGDRFGRRRVFLGGIAAFTVLSCVCALATDIGQLIVCRFLQGVAGGIVMPAASGIVAHHFGRDRDRAIALFTSVYPVGAILGPVLGGVVLTLWSWRGIFLVNVPIGIVVLVACAFLVAEPPRGRPPRIDLVGIALLMTTLLATMFAATLLGSLGSGIGVPVSVAVALVVAVAAGWSFLRHARRHPAAVVPMRLLHGRGLGAMNVMNVLLGASVVAYAALLPVYAQTRYALLPLAAGALLTARAVGTIATSGLAVGIMRRTGNRPLLMIGFAGMVSGLVITALPPMGLPPAIWLSLGAVLAGLGMGFTGPTSSNAGMHLVPDDVVAVAGLRIMFRQIGGIVAISVMTAAISASGEPGLAAAAGFAVLAVLMVGAALAAARIPNHRGRW